MSQPFHFSFHVTDLASTRHFYTHILGCREGRSTKDWVDFDFFGNQISCHVTGPVSETHDTGTVDGVRVPMPHFGAILQWAQFHQAAERIRDAGMPFIIEPQARFEGKPAEQVTMFLRDPSGNALEFKAFKHPDHVFTA